MDLSETRWAGGRLTGLHLQDVLLSGCRVDNPTCAESPRSGSKRSAATCVAWTCSAQLTSCRLHDADLTGADFSHSTVNGLRLHGSVLRDIVGAGELHGTVIAGDQQLDVAMSVFDAAGITVDDER